MIALIQEEYNFRIHSSFQIIIWSAFQKYTANTKRKVEKADLEEPVHFIINAHIYLFVYLFHDFFNKNHLLMPYN